MPTWSSVRRWNTPQDNRLPVTAFAASCGQHDTGPGGVTEFGSRSQTRQKVSAALFRPPQLSSWMMGGHPTQGAMCCWKSECACTLGRLARGSTHLLVMRISMRQPQLVAFSGRSRWQRSYMWEVQVHCCRTMEAIYTVVMQSPVKSTHLSPSLTTNDCDPTRLATLRNNLTGLLVMPEPDLTPVFKDVRRWQRGWWVTSIRDAK